MKFFRILTVLVLVCFLMLSVLPIYGEEQIYDNVIRFHVLANSDSAEDQALKLRVRDAILDRCAPVLGQCRTHEEAIQAVMEMQDEIRATAIATLRAEGCDDDVTVELGEEGYPEKRYETLCFPSGTYLSLRVCIGEAAGQNWWCVLFPPICMSAATASKKEAEDLFVAVGFTPEQYRIITETDQVTYKIKFKFLEFLESVLNEKEEPH